MEYRVFNKCRIMNTYERRLSNIKNTGSYLIEIIVYKEAGIGLDYFEIKIDNSDFYNNLLKLVNNEKERLYFAHGMTDIDMYKKESKYCIRYSPATGDAWYYYFEEEDFINNLVNAVSPETEKKY